MSIVEYQARLDEILFYVGGLLVAARDSVDWRIGRTFALAADSERLRYVADLLTNPESTREWEIGWDLHAIMVGWPESGAA